MAASGTEPERGPQTSNGRSARAIKFTDSPFDCAVLTEAFTLRKLGEEVDRESFTGRAGAGFVFSHGGDLVSLAQ